jgi:hypothetical protein
VIFIFWWEIIKSAKGSSKVSSKGSSFDASKIKVNIKDEESCVEKFNKIIDYIKEESKKIMDSSKLEHDLPASEDMANVWVWFGETQEDIEESSTDNYVHKTFIQYEHGLQNATNEEDACSSLKKLSTKRIENIKTNEFGASRSISVIRLPMNRQWPESRFSQISSEVGNMEYDKSEYYKSVYKRKPEIKQQIEETLDSFVKMQMTVLQMAKDAVREKGL